ncbi:major facilitator superfamily domain-containing protein [Desarmillaria tabescens]|uniref:Major facilitator superfamily domain-containing protein n=1 Tax=Armillaria tabescens TaxID=1929756 RepID=A0AA39ND76_ARMTA|nr:major facilitator superfamily domain-containing protein [Desarmillaria tabescens]KAK0463488.1 major facilitator superfamily domain-containing protein [Desarmillaria tabescens]
MHNSSTQSPGTVDEKTADESTAGQRADKNNRDADIQATLAADYPDGGWRAWLVVLGAMCSAFSTFGYVNAWGVFQAYYEEGLLSHSSASTIAWIGSIQYSLVFLPGLVTGRMFDLGYFKIPYFLASILLVGATFLVGECTKYWQLLLCQGFAIGLSCGMVFGPTNSIIGHWFRRKRGLAMGLAACGSSVGGTVFPIAARMLIPAVGLPWTMRIIGFILILSTGIANLTLERRLPPVRVKGGLANLDAFKSVPYTIYCISGFTTFLGLYTVLTYIDISSISVGISSDFSFYLVSIANAGTHLFFMFELILSLKSASGAVNYMAPVTLAAGLLTYAWPFARDKPSIIAICNTYGFTNGAYISSFLIPIFELGDMDDLGRRLGMAMTIAASGALAGPPISGAIYSATGGFEAVGYMQVLHTIVLTVVLMLIVRHLVLGRLVGKF